MKTALNRNSISIVLVLAALAAVVVACTRVKQIARGDKQSEAVKKLNYGVPAVKNAHPDPYGGTTSAFIIIMMEPGKVMLHNADAEPMDMETFSESLKGFVEGRSQLERVVYLAAVADLDSAAFLDVLDRLRKSEIDHVRLLASSRKIAGDDDRYFEGARDIAGPDSFFDIDIRTEIYSDKPNPLTLFIDEGPGRKPQINAETFDDQEKMAAKLVQVFRQREDTGIFRAGTNEVEKTVLYRLHNEPASTGYTQKYGDIVRMIDALRGAMASPIVLIDDNELWKLAPSDEIVDPLKIPTSKTPPPMTKTISGGVLNGKATSLPKPVYPPAAKAVRASGPVNVEVTIDENGYVVEANAVSGHPLLRASAEQAAKMARFTPTLLSGQKVKVTGVIVYNFAPALQ
jgi:TonB family protein